MVFWFALLEKKKIIKGLYFNWCFVGFVETPSYCYAYVLFYKTTGSSTLLTVFMFHNLYLKHTLVIGIQLNKLHTKHTSILNSTTYLQSVWFKTEPCCRSMFGEHSVKVRFRSIRRKSQLIIPFSFHHFFQ